MITRELVEETWGPKLWRLDGSEAGQFPLPPSAKQVLVELGLPIDAPDFLPEFAPKPLHLVRCGAIGHCVAFAEDGLGELAIAPTGAVLSVNVEAGTVERFVNSTLVQFLEFLLLVENGRRDATVLSDQELETHAKSLKQRLRVLDPHAFADPDSLWSLIAEEWERY